MVTFSQETINSGFLDVIVNLPQMKKTFGVYKDFQDLYNINDRKV